MSDCERCSHPEACHTAYGFWTECPPLDRICDTHCSLDELLTA